MKKLNHKFYNPNKKVVDMYGVNRGHYVKSADRAIATYSTGDCVVRAFTKLTDLDYTTVASMTAISNGYNDITKIHNGNWTWDLYRDYLKDMGIVKLNITGKRMNLRKTVVAAMNDDLNFRAYSDDCPTVSSLKDRYVTWSVTRHLVTTYNYDLYDSWDSSSRMVKATAYVYSDDALNNSFDWS